MITLGGKKTTCEDILKISYLNNNIIIDQHIITNFYNYDENKLNNKLFINDINNDILLNYDGPYFSYEHSKAIITSKLSMLLNYYDGKGGEIRLNLILLLCDMINNNIIPLLPISSELCGIVLSLSVLGHGKICGMGNDMDISEKLNNKLLYLTNDEYKYLSSIRECINGLSAIIASSSLSLIQISETIAAFSCETLKYPTIDIFDAGQYEIGRKQRGQIISVANIRLLISNSSHILNKLIDNDIIYEPYLIIPQIHGTARDLISFHYKIIENEINSFSISPKNPELNLITSLSASINLQNALGILMDNATLRLDILNDINNISNKLNNLKIDENNNEEKKGYNSHEHEHEHEHDNDGGFIELEDKEDSFDILLRGIDLIMDLNHILYKEFEIILSSLLNIENEKKIKQIEKLKIAEEKRLEREKKEKDELEKLSPEKRKKLEAKLKKKADKLKKKEAKKKNDDKKYLTIGIGTFKIYQWIKSYIINNNEENEEINLNLLNNFFLLSSDKFYLFTEYINNTLNSLANGGIRRKPKIPKGTRDFHPQQMIVREKAFNIIKKIFKLHGAVEIDTPVFELKETLTGKYGEDSKLIYDLADQGGELLSLRYDLTVPFARFLAINSYGSIKRYHIAKVYRRDQPQPTRGRYREFYQCDFDIAGDFPLMVADSEVLTVVIQILKELPIGNFIIKLNHRGILDSIFDICGVPSDKFRTICSSVDKLDKLLWEDVCNEMVTEKGLDIEIANKIGHYVCLKGSCYDLYNELKSNNKYNDFQNHKIASKAMDELNILFSYLDALGVINYISFDLSLARGLDYYTGLIYEAIAIDDDVHVGSIAAGGRYDNLVGMFSQSKQNIPCIGVSIGIERVLTIMESKMMNNNDNLLTQSNVQVYVASIGNNMLCQRMSITKKLWEENISSEYHPKPNVNLTKQLQIVNEKNIRFVIIFGEDELNNGTLKLKDMVEHTEDEIQLSNLINELLNRGCMIQN